MSKLENTILKYGIAVLKLTESDDPIGKPVDEAVSRIKSQVKELIHSAPSLTVEQENELEAMVEEL